jgi:hypothetical protein
MLRLSKKPYSSENDAYTVLELTLTNALNSSQSSFTPSQSSSTPSQSSSTPSQSSSSPLSNRFLARTRIISKSIAALGANKQLAPSYMVPIERALSFLSMPHIVRYTFSLDDTFLWPHDILNSCLAFTKDPETNMVEIKSTYRWRECLVLRSTPLSQLRTMLYDQVIDTHKTVEDACTVAEWLEKNKGNMLIAVSEAPKSKLAF